MIGQQKGFPALTGYLRKKSENNDLNDAGLELVRGVVSFPIRYSFMRREGV